MKVCHSRATLCLKMLVDTLKSIIACKFNGMAVHVLQPHANDGAKIAIRGEFSVRKTCAARRARLNRDGEGIAHLRLQRLIALTV
jgi:hypothetical protein